MRARSSGFLSVFAAVAFGLCSARAADDADGIKQKLFEAKKEYDGAVQKFRNAIGEALDKREEQARKAGNKKAVEQAKAERFAFESDGALPALFPPALLTRVRTARAKLDAAFTAAVKEHVRLKEDAEAEALEKELHQFQLTSAFLFGKRTHLTTLKPFNVKTEKDSFQHDFALKTPEDVIPHSIRLDPTSESAAQVSYTLAGKWSALRGRVGVPKFADTVRAPASELTFEVLGDGKSLWKSKPTNKLDEFQTCEVLLAKVKVLTLRVHCPNSGDWARACWLEPILVE